MISRRAFLATGIALPISRFSGVSSLPCVISTWDFGQKANSDSWAVLEKGGSALDAVEKFHPDVVLMDMVMPGLNGLEATRQIRRRAPKAKVLILTGYMEDEQILAALRAGASGYVVKKSDVQELLLGIMSVHRGNTYFSSAISDGDAVQDYLWQAKRPESKSGYDLLTSREREVLQLIAEGYSNQRIASELFISVKTVEAHKAHIMSKLHAQNRTDLIRYAIRKGLIEA